MLTRSSSARAAARPAALRLQQRPLVVRAAAGGDKQQQQQAAAPPPQPQQPPPADADAEARIEALEASTRRARAARRPIPIRNMTQRKDDDAPPPGRAVWKEGKLFPEGWESMDAFEKATELYMGQRGALFWANKLAFAGAWVLGGAWVLFRVVGPALGLYKLSGDLTVPPL